MSKLTSQRAAVFVGVFAVFGLFLNQFGGSRPAILLQGMPRSLNSESPFTTQPEQQSETAADRAAQQAAEERQRFIARYLNSGFAQTTGAKAVAIAVVGENGRYSAAVGSALADKLRSGPRPVLSSFFRPEFVSDGLFDSLYSGSNDPVDRLELAKSLDAAVLGRQNVSYSSDPALENVITATMHLQVTAISFATGQSQSWSFVASGAGFKQAEARLMAEERLLKQIAKDTRISL